jgi:hypothetical protein
MEPFFPGRFQVSYVCVLDRNFVIVSHSTHNVTNAWLDLPGSRYGSWKGDVLILELSDMLDVVDLNLREMNDIMKVILYFGNINSAPLGSGGYSEEWRKVLYIHS